LTIQNSKGRLCRILMKNPSKVVPGKETKTRTVFQEPSRRTFLAATSALAAVAVFRPWKKAVADNKNVIEDDFISPYGVAITKQGDLVVTDAGSYSVRIYHPDGSPKAKFGSPGIGPGKLNFPTGVAVLNEEIFVVDSNNGRIVVFDSEGNFHRSFGGLGINTASLASPKGICVGPSGKLVVANTRGHNIQVYDPVSGLMESAFGLMGDNSPTLKTGETDIRFRLPSSVNWDGEKLAIVDGKHGRLVFLDAEGRFISQSNGFNKPECCIAARDGYYLTAAKGLARLDKNGKPVVWHPIKFESAAGLAILPSGQLAVADFSGRKINIIEAF